MMEVCQWEQILINWVNCIKLSEPIQRLPQLRNGEFLSQLRKIFQPSTDPIHGDDLTIIFETLAHHYPLIKFEKKDSVHISDLPSQDLVNMTSLLMHYTSIYDRKDVLTSAMCCNLDVFTQLYIKKFLESVNQQTSTEQLTDIIKHLFAEPNKKRSSRELIPIPGTPLSKKSPLQDLLRTPSSKYITFQQTKKIEALKQELEAERADRDADAKKQQDVVVRLTAQLEQKCAEIKRLRAEVNNLEQSMPPNSQDVDNHHTMRLLKTQIDTLEQYIQKCDKEFEEIDKERDLFKAKAKQLETDCSSWKDSFLELEEKYITSMETSRQLVEKNHVLHADCTELKALLEEYRRKSSNNWDDSVSYGNRWSSDFDPANSGETLAHSVVELQLREVQEAWEKATEELQEALEEKAKLEKALDETELQNETQQLKIKMELTESLAKAAGVEEKLIITEKTLHLKMETIKALESEKDDLDKKVAEVGWRLGEAQSKLETMESERQVQVEYLEEKLATAREENTLYCQRLEAALAELDANSVDLGNLKSQLERAQAQTMNFVNLQEHLIRKLGPIFKLNADDDADQQLEQLITGVESLEEERNLINKTLEETAAKLEAANQEKTVLANFLELNSNELHKVAQEKEQILEALEMGNKDKLELEEKHSQLELKVSSLEQNLQEMQQTSAEHIELRLQELEQLRSEKSSLQETYEKECQDKQKLLTDQAEILENLQKSTEKEKLQLNEKIANLAESLEQSANSIQALEAEKDLLSSREMQLTESLAKAAGVEGKLMDAEKAIQLKMENITALELEKDDLGEKVAAMEKQLGEVQSNMERLECERQDEVVSLRAQLATAREENALYCQRLEAALAELEGNVINLRNLRAQLERSQAQTGHLSDLQEDLIKKLGPIFKLNIDGELDTQLEQLIKGVTSLEEERNMLNKTLELNSNELHEVLKEKEQILEALEVRNKNKVEMEVKVVLLERNLEELQQTSAEQIELKLQELEQLRAGKASLQDTYDKECQDKQKLLTDQAAIMENLQKATEKQKQQLNDKIAHLAESLEQSANSIQALEAEKHRLSSRQLQLTESLAKAAGVEGKLIDAEKTIQLKMETITALALEKDDLGEKVAAVEKQLGEAQSNMERLECAHQDEVESLRAQLATTREENTLYYQRLEAALAELEGNRINFGNLRAQLERSQAQTGHLSDLQEDLIKKLGPIFKLNIDGELDIQLEQLINGVTSLEEERNMLNKTLELNSNDLHELVQEKEQILEALELSNKNKVEMEVKVALLQRNLTELQQTSAEQIELKLQELEQLRAGIASLQETYEKECQDKQKLLTDQSAILENLQKATKKEKHQLNEEIAHLTESLEQSANSIQALEAEKDRLSSRQMELTEALAKAAEVDAKLIDAEKAIHLKIETITALELEKDNLGEKVAAVEKQRGEAQSNMERMESELQEQMEYLTTQLSSAREENITSYHRLEAALAQLDGNSIDLENLRAQLQKSQAQTGHLSNLQEDLIKKLGPIFKLNIDGNVETQLGQLIKGVTSLEEERNMLNKTLELNSNELHEVVQEKEQILEALEMSNKIKVEMDVKVAVLERHLEELQQTSAEQIELKLQELEQLRVGKASLQDAYDKECQNKQNLLTDQAAILENLQKATEKEKHQLNDKIAHLTESLEQSANSIQALQAENDLLSSRQMQLTESLAKAAGVEDKLIEADKELGEARSNMERLEEQVESLRTQLATAREENTLYYKRLEAALAELEGNSANLANLRVQLERSQVQMGHLSKLQQDLIKKLGSIFKLNGNVDTQVEQIIKGVTSLEEERNILNKAVELNNFELCQVAQEKDQILKTLEMNNKSKEKLEEEICQLGVKVSTLEDLQQTLAHQDELKLQQLEKLRAEKASLQEAYDKECQDKQKLLTDKAEILENLQKTIREKEELFGELNIVSSQLEAAKKENQAMLSDYQDLQQGHKEVDLELSNLKSDNQQLSKKLAEAVSGYQSLLDKASETRKEKEDICDFLQNAVQEKEQIGLQRDKLQADNQLLVNERDALQTKLQDISDEKRQIAMALELSQKETQKVKKERKEILLSYTEIIKETEANVLRAHETAVGEKRQMLNRVEQAEKERDEARQAYATVMAKSSKYELKNASLRQIIEEHTKETQQFSAMKEAYEKLMDENATLKQKRAKDRDEYVNLVLKEQEKRSKDTGAVRAAYEDKLEKMREKMLQVYKEQMMDEIQKFKADQAGGMASQQKIIDDLRAELYCTEQKLHEAQSAQSSRESFRFRGSESLRPSTQRGRGNKVADRNFTGSSQNLLRNSCAGEPLEKIRSTFSLHEDVFRDRKTATMPSRLRQGDIVEETVTVSRRTSITSLGRPLEMEDEEDGTFSNKYLADLREGRCFDAAGRASKASRVSELARRNTMVPPHLKSSYPAELQCLSPTRVQEDDIKSGVVNMDDSLCKLLPGEKPRQKKDFGTTSYKKPGPPTPSKNGGRASLLGNELPPLREANFTPKKSTPNRIRVLFKGFKDGMRSSRENSENVSPRQSKQLSIFRNRK